MDDDKNIQNDNKVGDDNINLIIDKKLSDAKLVLSEKRLNYTLNFGGALIAIFAIIIPLYMSNQSELKIDAAINRMESKFEKLAGEQLRKANIKCFFESKSLEQLEIPFTDNHINLRIIISNVGDRTTDDIKSVLYIYDSTNYIYDYNSDGGVSDEKDYNKRFVYASYPNKIEAKNNYQLEIVLTQANQSMVPAMLKIFYGDVEPYVAKFTFKKNR